MLCVTIGRSIVAEPIRENQLASGNLPERTKLQQEITMKFEKTVWHLFVLGEVVNVSRMVGRR